MRCSIRELLVLTSALFSVLSAAYSGCSGDDRNKVMTAQPWLGSTYRGLQQNSQLLISLDHQRAEESQRLADLGYDLTVAETKLNTTHADQEPQLIQARKRRDEVVKLQEEKARCQWKKHRSSAFNSEECSLAIFALYVLIRSGSNWCNSRARGCCSKGRVRDASQCDSYCGITQQGSVRNATQDCAARETLVGAATRDAASVQRSIATLFAICYIEDLC